MAETVYVPKHEGTKVLFKNRILERLTRTHISIPLVLLNVYSGISIYWALTRTNAAGLALLGMFFCGALFWTFFEYMVHRYVWHMETNTEFRARIQYKLHGVHHEYPRDKDRLALPIVLSLTIATILLFLYQLAFGSYGFGFFSGFVTGYTVYLSIHYIVHAYQPPKNFLKVLWINHGIHHYKDDDHAFGVSSPLWDYIFRTMPERKR
jgi:sterol desaturase/sphingolipid hydroxylase (fatty acid hydroxylase superfamily)